MTQPLHDVGQLQRGMTVTLEDGRVIEPSQVLDPPVPGHVSKRGS